MEKENITVVVNPMKVDIDEVRETWPRSRDRPASPSRPSWRRPRTTRASARPATRSRAAPSLVCALGGDGTVRAVAQELVGTGVPLGLLPGGTGNLLARNVGGRVDPMEDAARVAFTGRDRTIDVGWLVLDPTPEQLHGLPEPAENVHCFTVMAGVGFDAQMMADAPEGVKGKVGWAAYVASGGKHLTDPPFSLDLVVDGQPTAARKARTVVVGNCGELTGGMVLLPDALLDDGRAGRRHRQPGEPHAVDRRRRPRPRQPRRRPGARADQRVRRHAGVDPPQLCEVDGDVLTEASSIRFVLQPDALVVRVSADD